MASTKTASKDIEKQVEEVKEQAEEVQNEAKAALSNPWFERLARFGYLSKGAVYVIVGILAIQAALGTRAAPPDTQDALTAIVARPTGQLLLIGVAVGLLGYVAWRLVQALLDPENKGHDLKGIVQRIGYLFSGIAYGGVALAALEIVTGGPGRGQSDATEDWTARFLAQPFGVWLVILAGVAIIGYGAEQLYEAYSASFQERFKGHEMSDSARRWAVYVGRLGYAARGLVYGLIGWFLLQAAYLVDADAADGLREVLLTLSRQPYGPWLLGLVGIGLASYGLYAMFEARYRHVEPG
ncbi:MAG: DUF1206 domain-containing protein [Chloroflexota bacterium]|nr:DUF1206 domain-containing protein [Chloroflexota bacterium]